MQNMYMEVIIMNVKFVSEYMDYKLSKNEDLVIFTFFELRVKSNLSEEETAEFLELAKNKLTNTGYRVYYTGQSYVYQGDVKQVQDNELMIAVK